MHDKFVQLTKTNFIHYLRCSKSLWVYKRDPENYPQGSFSTFLQKLAREGYEVEKYVRDFFAAEDRRKVEFQRTFTTKDGLFAKVDAFEVTEGGRSILYEIKSSTSVKKDKKHDHLKDACFQKISAERAGQNIDQVLIVHLNGKYVREGEVVPRELLHFEDVTERVRDIYDETAAEMDQALAFLRQEEIDRAGCSCIFKSRAHHCDTFSYFNPEIPELSIFSLPYLSDKKRRELIADNIYDLREVPVDYPLSDTQSGVVLAAHAGKPQIDSGAIQKFLGGLQFPLYFFDYETFASAVPLLERISPHQHFPVQYSLHILGMDGTLAHKEFLQREPQLPGNLIEQMQQDFGANGSTVSWHASFEKKQNKEMAKWFPDKADFLSDLDGRMVDLEEVFKASYVDAQFDGSTSIKKVLPVLCPHLVYDELDVQDGASAMDAWQKMINADGDEAEAIAASLLEYCKLDTFAMVEIYRLLAELVRD